MPLWDSIKNGFSQDNEQFISFPIEADRTDDKPLPVAIETGCLQTSEAENAVDERRRHPDHPA